MILENQMKGLKELLVLFQKSRMCYWNCKVSHMQHPWTWTWATAMWNCTQNQRNCALCTLVFPWENTKCECSQWDMGLCNEPDVCQEKMSAPFSELDCVRTNIDDVLMTARGDPDDHLEKLDVVLRKLKHAGLKFNANESFFLSAWVRVLRLLDHKRSHATVIQKVEAMCGIAVPKNEKESWSFMGMANYYYQDSWTWRSDMLRLLKSLNVHCPKRHSHGIQTLQNPLKCMQMLASVNLVTSLLKILWHFSVEDWKNLNRTVP